MNWNGPFSWASTVARAAAEERCIARASGASAARCEPTKAWALAICLLAAGCVDHAPIGAEPSDESAPRAQTSTASADQNTVVIEQQKNLPVRLTGLFGAGCEGAIHKPDKDGKLVEVHFTSGYMVSLRSNEGRTQAYKSCDLQLTVRGAKGVRFSVQRVRYAGAAVLPSPSVQMKFQSEIFWKNTIFDIPVNGLKDHVIFGRHNGKWSLDHQVKIENAGWSKCLIDANDEDVIMINTSLSLDAEMPLDADAYLHSAFTDVITPPSTTPPSDEAIVLVDVATQPCTRTSPPG